jgi:hypothetical protein
MADYNAQSIRILKPHEINKFSWARVVALAEQYPMANTDFIGRGLEACRRCSVEPDYFIKRYLDKDMTIPINLEVQAAYKEIMKETVR